MRSLSAFEKSEHPDDWRDLMRLYMVRRTRTFIQENYAETDPETNRKFLTFEDGSRSYFPDRKPKTVKFKIDDSNASDQYARLYAPDVVDAINGLTLPRYGLGNYIAETPHEPPTQAEAKILQDLSRAGKRLIGFCRTNLFKRLESSGQSFLLSVERHILRNYIYLHAIEHGNPVPIGTQDPEMLDSRFFDEDADDMCITVNIFDEEEETKVCHVSSLRTEKDFRKKAEEVYKGYETQFRKRFKWLRSSLFLKDLEKDLRKDIHSLIKVLAKCRDWDVEKDTKLDALVDLIARKHPAEKILVFSQFADTVRYLEAALKKHITKLVGVTGDTDDPTEMAWLFSPESNEKRELIKPDDELRVLIATDVLSEGQNLQDCSIIVNYDLP